MFPIVGELRTTVQARDICGPLPVAELRGVCQGKCDSLVAASKKIVEERVKHMPCQSQFPHHHGILAGCLGYGRFTNVGQLSARSSVSQSDTPACQPVLP